MSQLPVRDGASLESLVAEVADEFLDRLKRGERPDVEEYARRHPPFASVLRQVLTALQLVHVASGPVSRSGEPGTWEPPPGLLGDFRIVREVGRGGMGVVYEARQLSLERRVALKVLPFAAALDPKQLRRFKNEARAAAQLHHTNIVPVFGVGCERGVHFYAMQFIEGRTLAEAFGDAPHPGDAAAPVPGAPGAATLADTVPVAGPPTERPARRPEFFRTLARFGLQAAEALEHAHGEGIIHRDVKPANLLVDARGNLWVTDFGLARLRDENGLTVSGDLVGTLRYMSPEQARGPASAVDHRTDVYALGATLYEMLVRRPVFGGSDRLELLRRIASEDPGPPRRLNPAVPAELETVVLKALEKEPAARYATAGELADDLRRYLEDKPIRARRPSWPDRARKWARRHRPAVASAAAALAVSLAVLAGSVGWILRDRGAREARAAADLEAALKEARESQRNGHREQARVAAKRAGELLAAGAGGPALAESARRVLGELAREEADLRLVEGLERIRFLQAEVDVRRNRFHLASGYPVYREVFGAYGWHPESTRPEEAAASLGRQPETVRRTVVGALDNWLMQASLKAAPEEVWLERVLAGGDPDPWRRRVREARKGKDERSLEELARKVDAASQPPEELFLLCFSLREAGREAAGLSLLKRARDAFPADFWINHDLGVMLQYCRPPQPAEEVRFLTAAVALRPDNAGVQLNLGRALYEGGRLEEAAAAFRRAVALRPDYAAGHWCLGVVLISLGFSDEGCAELRKAVDLETDVGRLQYELGNALSANGRQAEAAAAFRRAIELQPDYAEAYCNLGVALERQGEFAAALAPLERGHELGVRRPGWKYPSARWVRDCQRLVELERKLPEVVRGEVRPESDEEQNAFVNVCHFTKHYAASARLRAAALADKSVPADGLWGSYRYNAACAAALAGCGRGADAGQTTDEERARWRKQAVEWLRADLQGYARLLEGKKPADVRAIQRRLRHWQADPDLSGLRDAAALPQLADGEKQACRRLWHEAEALLGRAAGD